MALLPFSINPHNCIKIPLNRLQNMKMNISENDDV